MTVNAASLALIKEHEGWVPHWYPDPGTNGPPMTCCYGHTDAAGQPHYVADPKRIFAEAEGEGILVADLAGVERTVVNAVHVTLTDNERGALVSFVFNVGAANFLNSTLLKELNAKNYQGAADQLLLWTHAAGKVLPGLVQRRKDERALFLTPDARAASTAAPAPSTPTLNPLEQLQMNISLLTLVFHYLPLLPFLQQDLTFELKRMQSNEDGASKLADTLVVLKDVIAQIEAATAGTAIPPSPTP